MALDGIYLYSLLNNLRDTLINAKIDKVNQPEKDEVILTLRKERKNSKLLISSSSKFPRIHLTEVAKENPLKAPMFLMVLRKYLLGGTIVNVTQKDNDRVIILEVESRDEMGFNSSYSLIIEIMGRHSNITLVRTRDNKVMECIKHITPIINSFRVLYPGVNYVYPPISTKLNPFDFKLDDLISFAEENALEFNSTFFMNAFTGISKPLSNEIFKIASEESVNGSDLKDVFTFFTKYIESLNKNEHFAIYKDADGIFKDFHSCKLTSLLDTLSENVYESPSEMMDHFFLTKDKQERLHGRSTDLQKLINTNIERCKKKARILENTLISCDEKESFKIKGDLLTSFIYSFKKGDKNVTVQNFYSENSEDILIPLDENKTPSENVQFFYKKYNKLKKSEAAALIQLELNENELNYLLSVLTNIQNVESYDEIDHIKKELIETGYVKFKKLTKGIKREKESKPLHFVSSEGIDIYVGKNNLQNDFLSLKFANKNDTWLHTKNIPGSHVIINSNSFTDKTLEEAATIAAHYSKAKENSKVDVDYTLVKQLKKPSGAKPGMVIYHTNNSMVVDPHNFNKLEVTKL